MKTYQHLFFDLDHTLWDFETNSQEALTSIYYEFDLRRWEVQSPQHFIDTYLPINYKMWADYRNGVIDAKTVKRKRFQDTLKQFGVINQSMVQQVESSYLQKLPLGGNLLPNVKEMLTALQQHFQLHIVTNGFREITVSKLAISGIQDYFTTSLSAEEAGVLKPNPKIFQQALAMANATVEKSLFIGDNIIADVGGAKAVGIDQVFFNPNKAEHNAQPSYEIADMKELINLLIPR